MTLRLARLLAPVFILVLCAAATAPYWSEPPNWSPDSLFYEARVLELRGVAPSAAVDEVFFGKPGLAFRASSGISESTSTRTNDRRWIAYTQRLYQRRLVVPILAAAVYPTFGERSLEVVSLTGYFATGLLLFGLLRLRFGEGVSVTVAALFVLLQPLREWALFPLTDTWGMAFIIIAMLAGLLVIDRGSWWLPSWIGSVALLSITRDTVAIVVGAAVISALVRRDRTSSVLAITGIAAMLPSLVAFRLPVRQFLAYGFSGNRIPSDDGWAFVLSNYWPNLDGMLREYWVTMAGGELLTAGILVVLTATVLVWPTAIAERAVLRTVAAALLATIGVVALSTGAGGSPFLGQRLPAIVILLGGCILLALWPATDAAATLLRGSACTAVAFVAIFPQARGLRNELVLVPAAAMGVGLVAQRLATLLAGVRPARPGAGADLLRHEGQLAVGDRDDRVGDG